MGEKKEPYKPAEDQKKLSAKEFEEEPLCEYMWHEKQMGFQVPVAVMSIKPVQTVSSLLAMVVIRYGDVMLKEIKLIQGRQGKFLSWPARAYLDSGGVQKYQDYIFMETDLRHFLESKVEEEYLNLKGGSDDGE